MESINSIWQIGILALLAGSLIGALAYRHFAPSVKQAVKDKAELDAARDELATYKSSINAHFNKTSELVNDLTQNYVKVYQHLAEGAHTLGDSKTFNNLLQQHPGKVSLTVDGDSTAPAAAAAIAESVVAANTSSDTIETPVDEPATAANPETDNADTPAMAAQDEPAETPEPALDADAPDDAADQVDGKTRADAGDVMPEGEDEPETSRTVH